MKVKKSNLLLENEEIVAYLRNSRLFDNLPDDLLQKLIPLSKIERYSKGQTIIHEGKVNKKVFFLMRGSVNVFSGKELILKLKRKGDIFGEMSIILDKPTAASVTASEDIQVFTIQAKDIGKYNEFNSDLIDHVLYRLFAAILTEKLALTTAKAKQYEEANNRLLEIQLDLKNSNQALENDIKEKKQIEAKLIQRTKQLEKVTVSVQTSNNVLTAISHAQSKFIGHKDASSILDNLMNDLLKITDSKIGFIVELMEGAEKPFFMKLITVSNNLTDDFSLKVDSFAQNPILKIISETRTHLIVNNVLSDFQLEQLFNNDSPDSFLGIPFFRGSNLIGIVGIGNRTGGYDESVVELLQPFLISYVNLVEAQRNEKRRKKFAQKLKDSESRMRAIFDNAVEGIITTNEQGIIESVNPATTILFGYNTTELLGENVKILIPSPHHENHDTYLQQFSQTGEKKSIYFSREVEGVHKNGSLIPLDLSVSEIHLEDRLIFTAIIHDLREHKKVEQLKNEFVSTVSHELRTPLTSIYGGLKMALAGIGGEIPTKAKNLLEIAFNNTERLNQLVNDILDIQKIESGKIKIEFQHLDIVRLVRKSLETNQNYAEKFGVHYCLKKVPEKITINGDEGRLCQVMANLLSNAAKFSSKGDSIEVDILQNHGRITVSVTDHGSGIPEDFRDQVFEKFAQANSANAGKKRGTGLGLSITKQLIETHGGEIGFESKLGVGTRFFFHLPVVENTE